MLSSCHANKILVIDDEEIVRTSFCHSLEDLGYEVLQAKNGQQGYHALLQDAPDIVLTDLRMPLMNGIEFIQQCKAANIEIPIIVISGVGSMNDVIQAIRLGAFDFLTKPIIEPELLQATVLRALDQVRLKRENSRYQMHLEKLVAERTSELNKSNLALAKHKANLEILVKNRTQELETVIQSLNDTQEKLVESAKMASLGRLVAGVSHELNTPLGICVTFITSLQEKINSFEADYYQGKVSRQAFENFLDSAKESSSVVLNHLDQSCELIRSFKLVSVDLSSDMMREFDIADYVLKVVHSLSAQIQHHHVNIEVLGQYQQINSYPGVYSQILTNLLLNSLQHAFAKEVLGHINIKLHCDDQCLTIEYKDDGKGMTEEVKEKIFEPFYTTRRSSGGSGLGMSIVYNLVVSTLGGSIECTSNMGQGAEFVLRIPVHHQSIKSV